jgi:hypothetical protein
MEGRLLLSFTDGNGSVVTGLSEQKVKGHSAIVIRFDGPLNPAQAQDAANYRVNALAPGNLEVVTTSGPIDPIRSVSYDDATHQVTLSLLRPLAAGECYRVQINGTPGSGITTPTGTLIDGDNDDTAGGNFFGLIAAGRSLAFTDLVGNRATLQVRGGGMLELWRQINGNVVQLTVVGAVPNQTTLTGTVLPAKGGNGEVVIPSLQGAAGVINELPPGFVMQATPVVSPTPVVANSTNLPYSLRIDVVPMPSVPSIQSGDYAQAGGKWLVIGGRTNGLHGFDPTGQTNFPRRFQNNTIYVIDPGTGQIWSEPWSATGLPASVTTPLSSTDQNFYQSGDRLYAIGGYSLDPATNRFHTYDTLTAISVSGLINAVINHGNVGAQLKQIHDPRLRNTGGTLATLGNRAYLVFGQDFEGGYNGSTADGSQVYTDEVRSFRLVDKGNILAITDYKSQRDPVNFRRRDYNLAPVVFPNGQRGLAALGGVFTPDGNGFRNPIVIGPDGFARVNTRYQQYFSQYTSALVPLFDARNASMATVLFGGIGLYHYDFTTGTLTADTNLPFVNDVTSFVHRADGSNQEFIMPSQLPAKLGTEAAFFASPGLPMYSNGVVKLDQLHGPTTLGYIYGGIFSSVANTFPPADPSTSTTASNLVLKVTLIPN